MTLNLSAIFGAEPDDVAVPLVTDPPDDDPFPDPPDDPAERPTDDFDQVWPADSWPILKGTEHFSLYVDDPAGDWPEFVPGYHFDIRQPSRLRPLCSRTSTGTPRGRGHY